MNDLSNMPIVTPMNDSQWVPDGSGITGFTMFHSKKLKYSV